MSEKSDLRERARKAIEHLERLDASYKATYSYDYAYTSNEIKKTISSNLDIIRDLLAALDAAEREERERCAEALKRLPVRVEPISGQLFAYIQRGEAIDAIRREGGRDE